MKHLDGESDPRVGIRRRHGHQGHMGIPAESKFAAAKEGSVIAESNCRISLGACQLRHVAGIKIS